MSGWEPMRRITIVERDGEGRPSVLQVEQEPEWDEEQVALLLAAEEQLAEIGPHGVPMSEATSRLADPNNRFTGWHYEIPPPRIDHAQRALNLAQDERAKAYPDEDSGSLLWRTVRVEDGPTDTDTEH
jgi:hypothetical protein